MSHKTEKRPTNEPTQPPPAGNDPNTTPMRDGENRTEPTGQRADEEE
jgi:hypothetical protein